MITAHGKLSGRHASFDYDGSDRLVWASDYPWSNGASSWLNQGYPDRINALIEQHAAQSEWMKYRHSYTYDAADNLTQVMTPDTSWTAVADANNQYQTAKGTNWQYDAAGNLINDGRRTYAWDGAHRLVRITDLNTGQVSEFQYDWSLPPHGPARLGVADDDPSRNAIPLVR